MASESIAVPRLQMLPGQIIRFRSSIYQVGIVLRVNWFVVQLLSGMVCLRCFNVRAKSKRQDVLRLAKEKSCAI